MTDNETFNFAISKQPQGKPITPITNEEAERLFFEKLKKCESEFLDALWDMAYFYSRTGQQQVAQRYIERYIANTDDPEKQAGCYLALGQLMEQMNDFEAAITYYSQAFSLEPESTPTWYLINNNLGYSLNQLSRFAEAENYCSSAIRIDPGRQNAYKNLGVSLTGQEKYAQAADNLIKATHVNAADGRALKLVEQLFREHPDIANEIPDIEVQIQKCREAVAGIAEYQNKRNQNSG